MRWQPNSAQACPCAWSSCTHIFYWHTLCCEQTLCKCYKTVCNCYTSAMRYWHTGHQSSWSLFFFLSPSFSLLFLFLSPSSLSLTLTTHCSSLAHMHPTLRSRVVMAFAALGIMLGAVSQSLCVCHVRCGVCERVSCWAWRRGCFSHHVVLKLHADNRSPKSISIRIWQ